MMNKNNEVNIGNNNNIKNSVIGGSVKTTSANKSVVSNVLWKYIVPVAVGVTIAALVLWLGLNA